MLKLLFCAHLVVQGLLAVDMRYDFAHKFALRTRSLHSHFAAVLPPPKKKHEFK